LDHYVDTPTGRGFPNRENGKILSHAETLKRMLERLSSTDSKKRMPYKKSMDPEERNILFLWLNREIDKLPAGEKQNASE
jgi:hypothetical protein